MLLGPCLCSAIILLQRANEDLVPEAIEGAQFVVLQELLGRVRSGYLLEDLLAAWMFVLVDGDVENLPIDDDPQVILRSMLANLCRRDESCICSSLHWQVLCDTGREMRRRKCVQLRDMSSAP